MRERGRRRENWDAASRVVVDFQGPLVALGVVRTGLAPSTTAPARLASGVEEGSLTALGSPGWYLRQRG